MARACFVVLAGWAAVAAVNGHAATSTDADQVRAVIQRQATLFKQARWRELWQLYTPQYQARCGYATWLRHQKEARAAIGTRWVVRNIRVIVRGTRAGARYRIERRGRIVYRTRSADIYLKVGGRWRDAFDAETSC